MHNKSTISSWTFVQSFNAKTGSNTQFWSRYIPQIVEMSPHLQLSIIYYRAPSHCAYNLDNIYGNWYIYSKKISLIPVLALGNGDSMW